MAFICKRAIQLGATSLMRRKFCTTEVSKAVEKLGTSPAELAAAPSLPSSYAIVDRFDYKEVSQHSKPYGSRVFLVDTHALVKSLEAEGVPTKQAEALTSAIVNVLHDSLGKVSHSLVSKEDMHRSEMVQESKLSNFKSEMQSSQEHRFSLLQREDEKIQSDLEKRCSLLERADEKLASDYEKMRSELKYEVDKVIAGNRLDLNLEKGRMRDELANQNAEITNLSTKFDREIQGLRTIVEGTKYEMIKYVLGTFVSLSALAVAAARIFL